MTTTVRVENAAAVRTAVVRRCAKQHELSKVVPEACGVVWNVLRAKQVQGAGRHVALYLDSVINLEIGVELDSPFDGDGEVIRSTLPAGRVATVTHFGPYGRLAEAHQAIADWCKHSGHALAVASWEIYGHWQDDWNSDPSKIRTDVFYLLK